MSSCELYLTLTAMEDAHDQNFAFACFLCTSAAITAPVLDIDLLLRYLPLSLRMVLFFGLSPSICVTLISLCFIVPLMADFGSDSAEWYDCVLSKMILTTSSVTADEEYAAEGMNFECGDRPSTVPRSVIHMWY